MYRTYLPWYVDQQHDSVCIKAPKQEILQEDKITLLNWNVHKNNHHFKWLHDFQDILYQHNPNIITFQEYQTMSRRSIIDKHDEFGYGFFPNIAYKHHMYGLLSASKSEIVDFCSLFTCDVEPLIKTPKVSFVTHYKMQNGENLTLINVHMINFVKIKKYIMQIKQIKEVCESSKGAIILSGDFNTWSKKRMRILESMTQAMDLKQVTFEQEHHKKMLMTYPLDHIFYRGFKQEKSEVLKEFKTSDHKPMIVVLSAL